MSKKVYSLKRATPRMKYHHMREVMAFKKEVMEDKQQAMTEGTRQWMIEQIKAIAPDSFHDWYNQVYLLRKAGKHAEYEQAIRSKYMELTAPPDISNLSNIEANQILSDWFTRNWNHIQEIPL